MPSIVDNLGCLEIEGQTVRTYDRYFTVKNPFFRLYRYNITEHVVRFYLRASYGVTLNRSLHSFASDSMLKLSNKC